MKNLSKILTFISTIIAGLFLLAGTSLAATIWLNPTSGTYSKGSTIKVNVGVDTAGEAINAVQANIVYPADKLQYKSIATGGSALTIFAEKAGGGGFVKIGGGIPSPGFTGSKFIAAVYFTVLTDSGVATLTIAGDSQVLKNSDNTNAKTGSSTANFTLSGVSTAQDTSQGAAGQGTTSTTQAEVAQDTLVIEGVSVSNISKNSVDVSWKTTTPATSVVEYGLTRDYEFVESKDEFVTEHSVTLPSENLAAGTKYFYKVKSVDGDGNEAESAERSFKTRGYTLKIIVSDANGEPVSGATVELFAGSYQAETDKNGVATFVNIAEGTHSVTVKYKGETVADEATVLGSEDNKPVEKSVIFAPKGNSRIAYYALGVFFLFVVVVVVLIVIIKFKKEKVFSGSDGTEKSKPTVVNQYGVADTADATDITTSEDNKVTKTS